MANEKVVPLLRYSVLKAGEEATYNHLPMELIQKIMAFLKNDPTALSRYLSVNRRNRAQSKFFNDIWKQHAQKNIPHYCVSLQELYNLPEGSDKDYRLVIAKILAKAKSESLAVEYRNLTMGPPGPDAEAYETNPNAGKGSNNEMGKICLPGLLAIVGLIVGATIADKANFNRSGSIAFSIFGAVIGLIIGSIPLIYPCIQACRVKQQIKKNELQVQILEQDEEKGEGLPLLDRIQRR